MADNITYQAMIAENALYPKKSSIGIQDKIKMYFTSFPFQLHFLNFNANIGNSATSK